LRNALEQRLQTLLLLLAGTGAAHKLEGNEGQKPSEKDPNACLHGTATNESTYSRRAGELQYEAKASSRRRVK
jgi:hypothetical protein